MVDRVNIRPGVSVLSVLRHLNYRPWFAIAEFVDNSLQSFLDHRAELDDSNARPLAVVIEYDRDSSSLTISDNAAGISEADYSRAFRPAELPPNQGGLSEFGMGMKSAACWFAPRWFVETSALGEPVARTIRFDIDSIVNDKIEELEVTEREDDAAAHFTRIVLEDLYNPLHARTVGKIKEHLSDIYREFFRSSLLTLNYDNEDLRYDAPGVLSSPYYLDAEGPTKEWRKDIHFDFGRGLSVRGFAALRDPASVRRAGFALFRRKRLIQGSGDEGYRPRAIFGNSNSYTYQRLFGELHLEGFEVSHTKDGFKWDENEIAFLELLKEHLDKEPLPLLKQAEGHRKRRKKGELSGGAKKAVDSTARAIHDDVPPILDDIDDSVHADDEAPGSRHGTTREIEFAHGADLWQVTVTLTEDPAQIQWLELAHGVETHTERGLTVKKLGISLALLHPFMDRFAGEQKEEIEPLLRVAAGLGIAEHLAMAADVRGAHYVRRALNRLLREGLSSP